MTEAAGGGRRRRLIRYHSASGRVVPPLDGGAKTEGRNDGESACWISLLRRDPGRGRRRLPRMLRPRLGARGRRVQGLQVGRRRGDDEDPRAPEVVGDRV